MKYPDAETLIQKFQLTTYIIHRQTEGITNAESVLQLPFRGNCMNWILGHILTERNLIHIAMGIEPALDETAFERYRRESAPITGLDDGVPFDQLLAALDRSTEQIEACLKTIREEKLAEVGTAKEHTNQIGAMIAYIHWHETYHTGQFELLRQLAGKNDKVI